MTNFMLLKTISVDEQVQINNSIFITSKTTKDMKLNFIYIYIVLSLSNGKFNKITIKIQENGILLYVES